jgi:hypothetical protein
VLGVDQLHGVGPVPVQAQQVRPQRVGRRVEQAGPQDPSRSIGRSAARPRPPRAGAGVDLRRRSWWQHGAASTTWAPPADSLRQRLVRRGVARVQRQDDVGRLVRLPAAGLVDDEAHPGLPDPPDQLGVAGDDVVPDVHADRLDRPAAAEPAVGRQGQVGVAAAEVDHPQRPVDRLVGDDVVEAAEERVHLAALGRPGTDRVEERVVGGQPVLLGAVVRRGRPARVGRRGGPVDLGLAALGHPQLERAARVLDVPVAVGLLEQGVDRLLEGRALQGRVTGPARAAR